MYGEIVEPSTRALIIDDEEFIEYHEKPENTLIWEGNSTPPDTIETLTIADSPAILSVFKNVIQEKNIHAAFKNTDIKIYNVGENKYVLLSRLTEGFTCGEVVEEISKFITKAKKLYCITSAPSSSYINTQKQDLPECFIRNLSFQQTNHYLCEVLQSPNLITGICAAVLSYCIQIERPCSLYVTYIDSAPLDSITLRPIVNLLKQLNIVKIQSDCYAKPVSASNLYM